MGNNMNNSDSGRRFHTGNRRTGFTLAELLVTIAIIGILAAVSFVAVAQSRKNLKLLEMDNIAREIYVGAQNHLTESKAGGQWDKLVETEKAKESGRFDAAYWGNKIDKPEDGVTAAAGEHDYRRIVVNAGTTDAGSGVLGILLPLGSIDDTVRTGGSYAVEYDILTAQIYAVFYTDTAPALASSDIGKLYSESIKSGKKDYRKAYKASEASGKAVPVGYYGGAAVANDDSSSEKTTDPEKLKAITAQILNESRLLLVIDNPNATTGANSLTITLHDASSGASYDLPKESIDGTVGTKSIYILDSVISEGSESSKNKHFSRFGLTYGCDVYASVTFTATDSKTGQTQSVSADSNVSNSLFESYSNKTAKVANGRHLENLSSEISGIAGKNDSDVSKATLTASIAWKDDYTGAASFFTGLSAEETTYKIASSKRIVLLSDGKTTAENMFLGIASSTIHDFNGNGKTIANLGMVSGNGSISGKNVGLISKIKFAETETDKNVSISNLTIANASAQEATEGSSGIIIGSFNHNGSGSSITITGVTVIDPIVNVTGTANASGMIGYVGQGSAYITGSTIKVSGTASAVNSANGHAGGFIGLVEGSDVGNVTFTGDSIVDATSTNTSEQTGSFTVKAAGTGNAGGFFGNVNQSASNASVRMTGCSIGVGTLNVSAGASGSTSGASAGGLVGQTSAKTNSVTNVIINCNKISVSSTDNSGCAGGMIGKSSGEDTGISTSSCTGNELLVSSGANAGGLVGSTDGATAVSIKCSSVNGGAEGLVSGTAAGSSQGGLVGLLAAISGIDVEDSYSSISVSSSSASGTAGGIGGLIGTVDGKGTASAGIARCYSAGRTTNGAYTAAVDGAAAKSNVMAGDSKSAGGFVGQIQNVASNSSISDSYTTCSVYRAAAGETSGLGGFVGTVSGSNNVSIVNSYTTALVSQGADSATTTNAGCFAGYGSSKITASAEANQLNYYLSGINKKITGVSGDNGSTTIATKAFSDNKTSPFYVDAANQKTAAPYDGTLAKKYPYKTVAQLTTKTDLSAAQAAIDGTHAGDWPTGAAEQGSTGIFAENGNKLRIHIALPANTTDFTMAVTGLAGGATDYAPFFIMDDNTINWVNFKKALDIDSSTKDWNKYKDTIKKNSELCYIAKTETKEEYKAATKATSVASDMLYVVVTLDDISQYYGQYKGGTFSEIFRDMYAGHILYPGEDICVRVKTGIEKFDLASVTKSATTNSIFADGSNSSSVNNTTGTTANTALIANIRHLENLDQNVSNLNKDISGTIVKYTAARQIDNIHFFTDEGCATTAKTKAFITDMNTQNNTQTTTLYGQNQEGKEYTTNNNFFPLNSTITKYDGKNSVENTNYAIEGIRIDISNTNNISNNHQAAIFSSAPNYFEVTNLRLIGFSISGNDGNAAAMIADQDIANVKIYNVSLEGTSSIAATSYGYAGGLISYAGEKLEISNCSVSGASISSNGSGRHAGGLVGNFNGAVLSLSNCNASAYVGANGDSACAGGLIGSLTCSNTNDSAINKCFFSQSSTTIDGYSVHTGARAGQAGGLIGNMSSSIAINSSYSTGSVYAAGENAYAGGLVGYTASGISLDSYNVTAPNVNITSKQASAGGVIGYSNGNVNISNSSVTASGKISAGQSAGGILGAVAYGNTVNASNTTMTFVGMTVNGNTASGILPDTNGGAVTLDNVKVLHSSVDEKTLTNNIISSNVHAGGLLGVVSGGSATINNCFVGNEGTDGSSMAIQGKKYVGGVVGYNNGGTITSTGTIVAGKNLLVSSVGDAANTDSHVGGFIGLSTSGSINAKNCSASAYVYNTGNTAGGFIGQLDNTTGGFSYCYAGGHTHYGAYAGYALNTEKWSDGGINVSSYHCAGGFAGFLNGPTSVDHCFSTTSVKAHRDTGGFIGSIGSGFGNTRVTNSYETGQLFWVTADDQTDIGVARFIGKSTQEVDCSSDYYMVRGSEVEVSVLMNSRDYWNGKDANKAKSVVYGNATLSDIAAQDQIETSSYDSTLSDAKAKYPYKCMKWVDQNNTANTKYYGDWENAISFSITPTTATLSTGGTTIIKPTMIPEVSGYNASNISWSVVSTNEAAVNNNGDGTATLTAGTAAETVTVKASVTVNSVTFTAQCTVQVTNIPASDNNLWINGGLKSSQYSWKYFSGYYGEVIQGKVYGSFSKNENNYGYEPYISLTAYGDWGNSGNATYTWNIYKDGDLLASKSKTIKTSDTWTYQTGGNGTYVVYAKCTKGNTTKSSTVTFVIAD